MRNLAAQLKHVAYGEKLVEIQRDNTFKRAFIKSSKKARYKTNRQRAYYQVFAPSLTFEILSKNGRVPIKAVERRYFRWFPLVRGQVVKNVTSECIV